MEIKYEPVFGDQSLFDGTMDDCEFVRGDYGYKIDDGKLFYCEKHNQKYGWCKSSNSALDLSPVSAMRRIIRTQHTDDIAVDNFAIKMKEKLATSRAKGRSGWESCRIEYLIAALKEHVAKGDPVDVANFAMMISLRGESIKTPVWTVEDQKAGRLPEVGCRVNFCHKLSTYWRTGEIKYIDDQVTVIKADDIVRPFVYEVDRVIFDPIESPEEKAARLREEWCSNALNSASILSGMREYDLKRLGGYISSIYDAMISGDLPVPKGGE